MPTGYTCGIIDGKTKTFQEFAKLCMRAFGATIHMRDDSMNTEYVPRTPSSHHSDKIKEAKKRLKAVEKMSDNNLVVEEFNRLSERKEYYIKAIEKAKKLESNMHEFLHKANNFNPPTKDHEEIKKFMIEQLESTIDHDCSTKYQEESLTQIENDLLNIDAKQIRANALKDASHDIDYHDIELKKDIERCEDSNKWVEKFISAVSE